MDRMSMAHSLEARSPFLDTALIEYVARMPARKKVGLRRVKPLLRQAPSGRCCRRRLEPTQAGLRRPDGPLASR